MIVVPYAVELHYETAPTLSVEMALPRDADPVLQVHAALDTGASRSLFDGRLARALGIDDLLGGREIAFHTTIGASTTAHEHDVALVHEAWGRITMPLCFTTVPVARNLLGLDFLHHLGFGLQHRLRTIYLQP